MFINQVSVFLENVVGSLHEMTNVLGRSGADMKALSIADNDKYGVLRCILKSSEIPAALGALRTSGYTARLSEVICVCVPDRPSGLSDMLGVLDEANVFIEYIYSFVRNTGVEAMLILKLSDPEKGVALLRENGVKILTQDQVDLL